MKKSIFCVEFILSSLLWGSESNQETLQNNCSRERPLSIPKESIEFRSFGDIDRIDSLIHKFIKVLQQTETQENPPENEAWSLIQEIDSIIQQNFDEISDTGTDLFETLRMISNNPNAQDQFEPTLVLARLLTHVTCLINENEQDLIAYCLDKNWFKAAFWVIRWTKNYKSIFRNINRLEEKYYNTNINVDVGHHQTTRQDLQIALALMNLMNLIHSRIQEDGQLYKCFCTSYDKIVTVTQFLSVFDQIQTLVERAVISPAETHLQEITTAIDSSLASMKLRSLCFQSCCVSKKIFN